MSRVTTFREFWARSAHFGQNGGWDESSGARILCVIIQRTFWQLWPRKVIRCPVSESGKTFSKISTLGIICPQNLQSKIGQTDTSLRAGYRSEDALQRYTVYSALESKRQRVSEVGQFFCTTYGYGATGYQICPIFGFWLIFPIQTRYNVPSSDQPTAQGLHRRMITIFPSGS